MRLYFILLQLAAISVLSSQTVYAPEGAYWNYHYAGHSGGLASNWTIMVSNDSMVGGYPEKTLTKYYDNYYALPPYQVGQGTAYYGTLRLRNDSVFFYDWNPNAELFLYSFIMNVGDTIQIANGSAGLYAVVDSLISIILSGDTLNKWKLTKYCSGSVFGETTIIENIGPIDDYLIWNQDGCPIGGGWWTFQCYSGGALNYNQPCNPYVLGLNEIDLGSSITVWPNPADEVIKISSAHSLINTELTLLNSRLQVVNQRPFDGSETLLNISDLSSGLYFIRVTGNGGVTFRKVVVE